jgi:hypothetical protein
MTHRILTLAGVTAVLLALAVPARAQQQPPPPQPQTTLTPTYEVGLGYQWLRAGQFCTTFDASDCTSDDPQTFPTGLVLNGARNFGLWGVVGEVGWSRDAEELDDNIFGGDSLDNEIFHAAAGVRFSGRWGKIWPYVEATAGVAHLRFNAVLSGLTFNETRTRPLAQAGGGATFVVGDGWGLFAQADYRRMFLDEEEDLQSGRNDVRVVAGVRLILD